MSRIVIFDPTSQVVANRVINYIPSANTPDYSGNILINPDISLLTGINYLYWKVNNGTVIEMTADEKTLIDNSSKSISGGIVGYPMILCFYKNTTYIFNEYIYVGLIVSNKTGYLMMRNGTITSLSWNSSSTARADGSIIIQNNLANLASFPVKTNDNQNIFNNISYNFNSGDELSCYVSGSRVDNLVVLIEFMWRI